MHILIIEVALTGHHAGYLERIAAGYMDAGHLVTASVLQRDVLHPAIERLKARFGAAYNVAPIDNAKYDAAFGSRLGEPSREFALRRLFGQVYRSVNQASAVSYVFLPYLDYCLYALGLLGSPFGSTPWGGICMRPSFHYHKYNVVAPKPKFAKVKQELFIRLLKNKHLKRVYTIDELLHRYVAEQRPNQLHRLAYVADPAELKGDHTYETARNLLKIPDEAIVILVYGAIDERKGLDALVEALGAPTTPTTVQLLMVGHQSRAIEKFMQTVQVTKLVREKRVRVINKFVSEAEEQLVFAAANAIWLGYRKHYGMSGVLIIAASLSKPIIACDNGLIGWYSKDIYNAAVININNQAQVQDCLQRLKERVKIEPLPQNEYFIKNHTWKNFICSISE